MFSRGFSSYVWTHLEFWALSHTHSLKNVFRLKLRLMYSVSGMSLAVLFFRHHGALTRVLGEYLSPSATPVQAVLKSDSLPGVTQVQSAVTHSQLQGYTVAQSSSLTHEASQS